MLVLFHIPNKPQRADRAGIPGVPADWGIGEQGEAIEHGYNRNSKKPSCGNPKKTGKASSKLSDSLREKITGCGAGRLYGE